MSRVRVYLGVSLDGYVAGLDHDLSWLDDFAPAADTPTDGLTFPDFFAQVGALLMGRGTYDVVAGFDVPWPYGDTPVLVATSRPLEGAPAPVTPVSGTVEELVAQAKRAAGDRDVYLDGGALVRSGLDAGLVDELCLTVIPVLLGAGVSLWGGLTRRTDLKFTAHHDYGGLVQLTAVPKRSEP